MIRFSDSGQIGWIKKGRGNGRINRSVRVERGGGVVAAAAWGPLSFYVQILKISQFSLVLPPLARSSRPGFPLPLFNFFYFLLLFFDFDPLRIFFAAFLPDSPFISYFLSNILLSWFIFLVSKSRNEEHVFSRSTEYAFCKICTIFCLSVEIIAFDWSLKKDDGELD